MAGYGEGVTLRLRRHLDCFGCIQTEVVEDDPQTLAQVGYSIVAMTLAEPLRKAVRAHLDEHGCSGVLSCPEANRLFRLLPAADQILIG